MEYTYGHSVVLDGDDLYATPSEYPDCYFGPFREARKLSELHDKPLAACTKRMNQVLKDLIKKNNDKTRKLAVVNTGRGVFLAWVRPNLVNILSPDEEIDKALGLKPLPKSKSTRTFRASVGAAGAGDISSVGTHRWESHGGGHGLCRKGGTEQTIVQIIRFKKLTKYHDQNLADGTGEFQRMFDGLKKTGRQSGKTLCFLDTGRGLFLAWTTYGPVSLADRETMYSTLGLELK